jgi:hypothetical protein
MGCGIINAITDTPTALMTSAGWFAYRLLKIAELFRTWIFERFAPYRPGGKSRNRAGMCSGRRS